ncbi:MAG TPA: MqnA/MqnD/SBP family protein, partial [Thermoanaerobaculia bacterium]|nr:MqnA/MqnD/SBP family protein [Thermoanaerobaculia bacterium]
ILLKRVYGLEPVYRDTGFRTRETDGSEPANPESRIPNPESTDAALIIGDPALKTRLNGQVVLDLAAEWRALSGHSFVFAFWAAREEAATPELGALLRRSYQSGRTHFASLVAEEAARTGLSQAVVEDYLRHSLHYELDESDLAGLELFYRMAAESGSISVRRPLSFLPA